MLDALTLDQLRVFVAVAETGSFRAAAVRLRRVQSAVSYAIAGLESELGVSLFDRTGRRPELSANGRALLAHAKAMLLDADALRAHARALGEGLEPRLDLALDPQFPLPFAAAALRSLHSAYPTVQVQTWTAPLGAAIAALQERRCTLAVTAADIPDPAIDLDFLCDLPRAAVASAGHPLADWARRKAPLKRRELAGHLQIVVPDPSALTAGQDFGVLSPGTWRVSDNETKRALIVGGVGWGNLPLWLVQDDLAAGRLVRLPVAEFAPSGETYVRVFVACRADVALGPAARLLVDRLREVSGEHRPS
ncbi:LysR family transcriptional regulator [Phenylobacterium sp.]|jgi:DNA-binding transcriptional LysR family regulator|uniref:LysR family transcriptional regulator n=1 Tax=Phenylobacterium sp. TaxID=1871053 RepID=UPI002E34F6A6|nr:LysR family transcriptional regulator [Phenylobacterium sp.]HEX2559639.1 LysR family transcriptional regulator [Phenylobacterium sp.]